MIRILQYIGSLEQGGSQAMIMNLYRNIERSKVQFDFVIHDGKTTPLSEEAQKLGAVIYCCPTYGLSTAREYSTWWNAFFKEHSEYKIIHSHVRSTAAIVLSIAKKAGCKTIAHSHSTSSGSGISAVVKNLFQYRIRYVADFFMGCSQVAGEWLFGKKICASDRYFNVRNAIDAEKYIYDSSIAKEVRSEFGYTDNDFVIGHVGRFSEPKNHTFLLDIFYEVHKKNPKYKLLLVGDGELRGEIEKRIKEYGIKSAVTLTGVRTDVNRLMMGMDLFLFPSLYEGLGIVMIEAQAAGCPCIASNGVPEEAKISDLVMFNSLEFPKTTWMESIYECKRVEREKMYNVIVDKGYDIIQSAKWIQQFYETVAL